MSLLASILSALVVAACAVAGHDILSILLVVLLCRGWFCAQWPKNPGRLHEWVA